MVLFPFVIMKRCNLSYTDVTDATGSKWLQVSHTKSVWSRVHRGYSLFDKRLPNTTQFVYNLAMSLSFSNVKQV